MFEWLLSEAARIKTGKFFVFKPGGMVSEADGSQSAASPLTLDEVERQFGELPAAYKAFAKSIGSACLFRDEETGYYGLRVFAEPRVERKDNGDPLLCIGIFMSAPYTAASAYLKPLGGQRAVAAQVFEGNPWQLRLTSASFEAWFEDRYRRSRERYNKAAWQLVVDGPPPFDAHELAIVAAIPLFKWRKVGIRTNGKVEFEIHNGSAMLLPGITLGIRACEGTRLLWTAGMALPTADLEPGTTKRFERDFSCYGSSTKSEQLEFYSLPLPEPEDRCLYWEFGSMELQLLKPMKPGKKKRDPLNAKYRVYGPGKEVWDVGLDDLIKHPIWLWAEHLTLNEEEVELGGTEAWMRPALKETNITADMHLPLILLKVAGTNLLASGLCNQKERLLESISVFINGEPAKLSEVQGAPLPIVLEAVPIIEGKKGTRFQCGDLESGAAKQQE